METLYTGTAAAGAARLQALGFGACLGSGQLRPAERLAKRDLSQPGPSALPVLRAWRAERGARCSAGRDGREGPKREFRGLTPEA